jgi:hypothetical protein
MSHSDINTFNTRMCILLLCWNRGGGWKLEVFENSKSDVHRLNLDFVQIPITVTSGVWIVEDYRLSQSIHRFGSVLT